MCETPPDDSNRGGASEKFYALLLRLYPSRFRDRYGAEALALFRDRCRDEQGLIPKLRLWTDLIADLAISLLLQHWRGGQPLANVSTAQRAGAVPSFQVLDSESLPPGAFLIGALLSLAIAGLSIPITRMANFRPFPSNDSGPGALLAWQNSGDRGYRPESGERGGLDSAERSRVIQAVVENLNAHYVDSAVAQSMVAALAAHEKAGDYNEIFDATRFAALLTKQLRGISGDMHLEVVHSAARIPDRPSTPTATAPANCGFEPVRMLPHNIGYLKFDQFANPSPCAASAAAALASLNHEDAIIFDLRENRGGYPGMVMLIAAWLFDHPEYMYNPRENMAARLWTRSPVPESRLADKPVYILTSGRTASAAEHLSYNLKMLKRATLVGERTRGAADVGAFHRIDDHFGIGIRETNAIDPYAEPDWAVTGIEPDVEVKAADALITAEKLAQTRLRRK